jgi:hypothetical protein
MKKNAIYFVIGALVLSNLYTLSKLDRLKKDTENLYLQNQNTYENLRRNIDNIYANVDERLKKQMSILDSHEVKFGEFSPSDLTVPVTVTITPKDYSEGLTASVELKNKSFPMKKEGTTFAATIDYNIFEELKIKVALEDKEVKKIETIEEFHDLRNKYLLDINANFNGETSYHSNLYSVNGKINFSFNFAGENNKAEKISIVKEVNGNILDEKKVEDSNYKEVDFKENIKLTVGDKLCVYANIEDSYGFRYKYAIMTLEPDSEGGPSEKLGEMSRVIEIRDKTGKILFKAEGVE